MLYAAIRLFKNSIKKKSHERRTPKIATSAAVNDPPKTGYGVQLMRFQVRRLLPFRPCVSRCC
jgi:hypothetical protein